MKVCLNCKFICVKCKSPIVFDNPGPDKTVCTICGAVNELPKEIPPGEEWLGCKTPDRVEWNMTSGVKGPDVPMKQMNIRESDGRKFIETVIQTIDYDKLVALPLNARITYMTSDGGEMTRIDWIKERGIDPAIELKNMRERMKKPRPVYVIG